MDEITQEAQTQVIQQSSSSMTALLIIVLIAAIVLVVVVIIQRRRINEMQRPKYGFLGKPLNSLLLLTFLIGGVGFFYYASNMRDNEFTNVSASSELSGSIIITEIDSSTRTYRFNVIPTIDNIEWGMTSSYSFDVQWTVANGDIYQSIETGLNLSNIGGLTLNLQRGTYQVTATVFVGDRSVVINYEPGLVVE